MDERTERERVVDDGAREEEGRVPAQPEEQRGPEGQPDVAERAAARGRAVGGRGVREHRADGEPAAQRQPERDRVLGLRQQAQAEAGARGGDPAARAGRRVARRGEHRDEGQEHAERRVERVRLDVGDVRARQRRHGRERGGERRRQRRQQQAADGVGQPDAGRGQHQAEGDGRAHGDARHFEDDAQEHRAERPVPVGEVQVGQVGVRDLGPGDEVEPGVVGRVAPPVPGDRGQQHGDGRQREDRDVVGAQRQDARAHAGAAAAGRPRVAVVGDGDPHGAHRARPGAGTATAAADR